MEEGEPEEVKLVLGVPGLVAHWLEVKLAVTLPSQETEGVAEAVPRLAPAPLVLLGLTESQPLLEGERVGETEPELEGVKLAPGE